MQCFKSDRISESHPINSTTTSFQSSSVDFGLLFWFECRLISAPASDCHSALCWKSTDCNHFTCSLKSQHRPWFIIHRAERERFKTQSITVCQVTAASRVAVLNGDYKSDANRTGISTFVLVQLYFIKFQSRPIFSRWKWQRCVLYCKGPSPASLIIYSPDWLQN